MTTTAETETVTETAEIITAPEPSPWPAAEEILSEHPEWSYLWTDREGDQCPPPRYLADSELYNGCDQFTEENRRAEEIDSALYDSLYRGALQRVHESTWVVDGTTSAPEDLPGPDGRRTADGLLQTPVTTRNPHDRAGEPDPAADEAQADADATLKRWGADPDATTILPSREQVTAVLDALPPEEPS